MNNDVLSNIAAYGGVDVRRTLGFSPGKLCRNADFDLNMQTICHKMHVFPPTRSHYGRSHQCWKVTLNAVTTVVVDISNAHPALFNIVYYLKRSNNIVDICQFSNNETVRGTEREGIICNITVSPIGNRVRASFVNGQWQVAALDSLAGSQELDTALREHGFVVSPQLRWLLLPRISQI
jgi:hypothetical protein